MAEIHHQVGIEADPEVVYRAISTEDGLKSFWTDQVRAKPELGAVAEFGFGPEGSWEIFRMRIKRMEPPSLLEWECVGCRSDEWEGTTVRWEITPNGAGGTTLRFHHEGWESSEGELPGCSYVWAMILSRLTEHARTGQPVPWFTS